VETRKVWVVEVGEYETVVTGIYSSKERAEAAVRARKLAVGVDRCPIFISEWVLDEGFDE
jgi:hypothetical protein